MKGLDHLDIVKEIKRHVVDLGFTRVRRQHEMNDVIRTVFAATPGTIPIPGGLSMRHIPTKELSECRPLPEAGDDRGMIPKIMGFPPGNPNVYSIKFFINKAKMQR